MYVYKGYQVASLEGNRGPQVSLRSEILSTFYMSSSQIERRIRRSESGFEENALPAWQPYEALQGNTLDVKFGSADFCHKPPKHEDPCVHMYLRLQ